MPPSSSRRIRQVSFKNEAVLDVNIESLDSLYDEQGNLDSKFKFTVKDGYEEKFCGSLIVIHENNGDSTVDIFMKKNYKNLKATWINLTNDHLAPKFKENLIPLVNSNGSIAALATMVTRPEGRRIAYRRHVALTHPPQRFFNLRGTLKLSFEPKIKKGRIQKRRLTLELNKSKLNKEAEDFTIICQDQQFGFNRFYLSMISPVFEKMQSERWNKGDNENSDVVSVEEKDFPPETIQSFKNIIYDKNNIEEKDLTPELLMFCDKYDIQPLFKICHSHLLETFTKDNLLERIKVCRFLNDGEKLLKEAAKFVKKNLGNFQANPEMEEFMTSNPECWTKIMQLMMFEK